MTELNKLYAKKLLETNSHDKAMLKVAWVTYKLGIEHEKLQKSTTKSA